MYFRMSVQDGSTSYRDGSKGWKYFGGSVRGVSLSMDIRYGSISYFDRPKRWNHFVCLPTYEVEVFRPAGPTWKYFGLPCGRKYAYGSISTGQSELEILRIPGCLRDGNASINKRPINE